jgi:hypothetical protein
VNAVWRSQIRRWGFAIYHISLWFFFPFIFFSGEERGRNGKGGIHRRRIDIGFFPKSIYFKKRFFIFRIVAIEMVVELC